MSEGTNGPGPAESWWACLVAVACMVILVPWAIVLACWSAVEWAFERVVGKGRGERA